MKKTFLEWALQSKSVFTSDGYLVLTGGCKCHICSGKTDEEWVCEICDEYYCENCSSTYNQFSQIDYNCCRNCQEPVEN